MGKEDILNEIVGELDDSSLVDMLGRIEAIREVIEEAEGHRVAALESITTAIDCHCERQWDDRNDAIAEAEASAESYAECLAIVLDEVADIDLEPPSSDRPAELEKVAEKIGGLL